MWTLRTMWKLETWMCTFGRTPRPSRRVYMPHQDKSIYPVPTTAAVTSSSLNFAQFIGVPPPSLPLFCQWPRAWPFWKGLRVVASFKHDSDGVWGTYSPRSHWHWVVSESSLRGKRETGREACRSIGKDLDEWVRLTTTNTLRAYSCCYSLNLPDPYFTRIARRGRRCLSARVVAHRI